MRDAFRRALEPILERLAGLDPAEPTAAEILNRELPADHPAVTRVAELFEQGVAEGWLCDRSAGDVRYSRVHKAASDELSIDAVRMVGPGPGHAHPNGEFDLCLPVSGSPRFDGKGDPWVVYPPGSWHVPTVESGTMNILYFLPGGAIEFGPRPSS